MVVCSIVFTGTLRKLAEITGIAPKGCYVFPEFKPKKTTVLLVNLNSPLADLLDRFAPLENILRIVSYCIRFFKSWLSISISTVIITQEISHSLNVLICFTQYIVCAEDINRLTKGIKLSKELGWLSKVGFFYRPRWACQSGWSTLSCRSTVCT